MGCRLLCINDRGCKAWQPTALRCGPWLQGLLARSLETLHYYLAGSAGARRFVLFRFDSAK